MSVQRRVNFLSQQRVDLPDMRAIESASSNDFDGLIQSVITGTDEGYVLRGFELSMTGAIGGSSAALQMIVDPGAILHVTSSQSGTFYLVPSGTPNQVLNSATNSQVNGAFSPNSINYVGIEYERSVDDTTAAQVYLWDPTTNSETTTVAPRAIILNFNIFITTSLWASNVLPIAIVETDSGNNVISITDCRNNLFRLGQGGAVPNPFYVYPWTAQPEGRTENPPTSTSNSVNPFEGGDKMLGRMKDWMDAIMSSLLEIKGTTYWYSENSSGSLASLREDLGNTVVTGSGSISHGVSPVDKVTPTAPGQINWDQPFYLSVVGSSLSYQFDANPTSAYISLSDQQVAYVTLIRDVQVAPNLIFTNGSNSVTSVGSVSWTANLLAGDYVKLASDTHAGYYEIQTVNSLTTVTLTTNFAGTSTGATGAVAQYAFGSYQAAAVPSTQRDIYIASRNQVPVGENIFWMFMRADNGGAVAKAYIKFLGAELDNGEDREVSDTTSQELLLYIGSPFAIAHLPQYVSALNPGSVPQITNIICGTTSTMNNGEYFLISSSGNFRNYAVWVNISGGGTQPVVPNVNAYIEWDVSTGWTSAQTAASLVTALNGTLRDDFLAVQGTGLNTNTVAVTNTSAGTCTAASNVSVGLPFSITITQSGTGIGNYYIKDGDNLTLAIKEVDEGLGDLVDQLNENGYDETVTIVSSGATPPTSLNGPIISGTLITLPNNTRLSNATQYYLVNSGKLAVFLNGQELIVNQDYSEYGTAGAVSTQIQILQGLVVGDILEFRILGGGGGGGGGLPGPAGPAGPQGPQGIPGADAAGGPVAISTKTSNYSVMLSDNVLLANCVSGNITFSLPPSASATGRVFYFKKIDSTSNNMTIQANGVELIDGSNTQATSTQYVSYTLICDGTQYWIM